MSTPSCGARRHTPLLLWENMDHVAVDLPRKRLFVAELGNGTVDVIDIAAGKAIHRIGGSREPQGIRYVPVADLTAIANAGDGSVTGLRATPKVQLCPA